MEREEILLKVQDVFRDVLENNDIILSPETTSNDLEEWDSLSHIQLIVGIEKKLGIKFTAREINEWKNIGEMIECINNKMQ